MRTPIGSVQDLDCWPRDKTLLVGVERSSLMAEGIWTGLEEPYLDHILRRTAEDFASAVILQLGGSAASAHRGSMTAVSACRAFLVFRLVCDMRTLPGAVIRSTTYPKPN